MTEANMVHSPLMPLKRWLLLWSIGTSTGLEFPPTSRRKGRFRAPSRRVDSRRWKRDFIPCAISFEELLAARAEGFILIFMYREQILRDVVPSARARAREAVAEVKVSPFSLLSSGEQRQVYLAFVRGRIAGGIGYPGRGKLRCVVETRFFPSFFMCIFRVHLSTPRTLQFIHY